MNKTSLFIALCLTLIFSNFSFAIENDAQEGGGGNAEDGLLQQAEIFIQDLGDTAIEKLTGKDLTSSERNRIFEELLVESFDYENIGKFVLGRYRRGADPDELKEYIGLFKSTISSTYAARFGEYNQEKFQALSGSIKSKSEKNTTIVVKSVIIRPNGTKINIDWNLYKKEGSPLKIFDVVVEGVSMAVTQRDEYSEILSQKGLAGLNKRLKERQETPQLNA